MATSSAVKCALKNGVAVLHAAGGSHSAIRDLLRSRGALHGREVGGREEPPRPQPPPAAVARRDNLHRRRVSPIVAFRTDAEGSVPE